jgi:hypothetical protein
MGEVARIMMGWQNRPLIIRQSQLMQHTSKRTALPQAWCKKRGRGRLIGQTKGGMNTKHHAVTDTRGRPVRFFITAGQVSDYTGAAALMNGLPGRIGCLPTGDMTPTGFEKAL